MVEIDDVYAPRYGHYGISDRAEVLLWRQARHRKIEVGIRRVSTFSN